MQSESPKIDKRSREYRKIKEQQTVVELQESIPDTILDNIMEPNNQHIMQQEVIEQPVDTGFKIEAPEVRRVKGKIAIKPYVSGEEKMGLEIYGESLFPGTYQIDRIGCGERNGFKTYITGLDEMAAEVQTLPKDKKRAKIRTIREVVSFLENAIGNNFEVRKENCMDGYETSSDSFWKKVKTFNSTGPDKFDQKGNRVETYWDKVELHVDNKGKSLNLSDPHDLVIFHAIEAGGLSLIAPSLQAAIDSPGYNFYLDQPAETSHIRTEFKKLRNKAGGHLEDMLDTDQTKLFYMAKILTPVGSSQYKRGGPGYTPPDQMYDDMCNYIDGKTEERDANIAVKRFNDYHAMPIDELMRRAVLKDATEMRMIEARGDGNLWYVRKNARVGKNIEDMSEYFKNPLNDSIWEDLLRSVEMVWAE